VSTGVEGRAVREVADVFDTDEARGLLESAQVSGSLSADEIALALDELELDAGQIDDFYRTLEEMQIDVVGASAAAAAAAEAEEKDERLEAEAREISTDSLQLFLKDIGKVDLLTAAQEVELAKRIERVLTNDPGIGVARHVDAGYEEAKAFAEERGVKIPMPSRASKP